MRSNVNITYPVQTYSPPATYYSDLLILGTCEADFLTTNVELSETTIMLSQVDQALCDEAEAGRIHGNGVFSQGYWECGATRLNLHRPWYPGGCNMLPQYENFASPSGQPYIEKAELGGYASCLNNTLAWNTNFIYLQMSTGIWLDIYPFSSLEPSDNMELSPMLVLRDKFSLSGCWGGKNRVAEKSNWYEDKTLQNYPDDKGWTRELVYNSEGIPSHSIIWQRNGDEVIVLPETILRRPEFGPRRGFWLSEPIHYPICRGKAVSGIVNVTLSLPKNGLLSDDLFLCYPGGANAVGICDLSLIRRAKKVNLLILNKQGIEGWKFAMLFAARLRKEHISFSIKLLNWNKHEVLSLKKFRKHLHAKSLIIPEELNDDFGGCLNAYMEHKRRDLIPGILGKGETMLITGEHSVEVAFYLATSVKHGCWDGGWRAAKRNCKVALFADRYDLRKIEKVKIPTGVDIRSGDILLENAKQAVSKCSLVIFASQAMRNDKARFIEILDFCLKQDISAIVFSTKTDSFLEQNARRFYSIRHSSDNYTLASQQEKFGVRFSLNGKGQLASCCNLEEHEIVDFDSNSKRVESDNGMNDFNKSISNIPQGQIFNSIEDLIGN